VTGIPILSLGSLVAAAAMCCQALARADQGWGVIRGRVVYSGPEAPIAPSLNVDKDKDHCLSKGPIQSEELVVNGQNKGVRWVFVWLAPEKGAPPLPVHPLLTPLKERTVVLDQPCCRFEPHALGMRQGQILEARNSGKVAHSVHWTGHPLRNPGGNVIVPAGKSYPIENLKADDRFPVKISCDIHGWMSAWVRVFDQPYFAVTDADGRYEFRNAPAGRYRLKSWSDRGYGPGMKDGIEVTIRANQVVNLGPLEFPPK
jgi:hypothetical protein